MFKDGVAAIRRGDAAAGRDLLAKVVEANPMHEQAWLWLSGAVEDREERIICLENVLTINPRSEIARRGLEKLGGVVPPLPDDDAPPPELPPAAPPLLGHVAPDAVGADLDAVLTGRPRPAAPQSPKSGEVEAWRAALYDPDYVVSTATLVPSPEPRPHRTLGDLFGVWTDMLYFNVHNDFDDEMEYGGFLHSLANIAAGGLLQALGAAYLIVMLFLVPQGRYQPLLLSSTVTLLQQASQTDLGLNPSEGSLGPTMNALEVLGFSGLFNGFEQQVAAAQDEAAQAALELAALIGVGMAAYAVLSIPLAFISVMWQSIITSWVAGSWLQGKGDTIQTMQALTLALAVAQIVQLPVTLILPFVPITTALVILAALRFYQFLLSSVSIGRVHRFGILLSMGTLIMSGAVADAGAGLLGYGLSFLSVFVGR